MSRGLCGTGDGAYCGLIFFFSSRRRHTRFDCDWSSDVCSSDLACDRKRSAGARLGPLHGLPIPIKDSVNTKDLPTTAGTPALRNFQPSEDAPVVRDRKSTRLNSSHSQISYAVFCLKKKKNNRYTHLSLTNNSDVIDNSIMINALVAALYPMLVSPSIDRSSDLAHSAESVR